jgi:SOS-response transcriptional repressor LexA
VTEPNFTQKFLRWIDERSHQQVAREHPLLSQSSVSRYAKGETPGRKFLDALVSESGLSLEYWFGGDANTGQKALLDLEMIKIPILSATASAGGGIYNDDEAQIGALSFDRTDPVFVGASIKHLHLIRVQGDSMEPTILHGRLVMIDASKRRHGNDGIYAIRSGEGEDAEARIKRLRYSAAAGVDVISDNPLYPVESVPDRNTISLIGRAIWTEKLL